MDKTVEFIVVIESQINWVNSTALLIESLRRNGERFKNSKFTILVISDEYPGKILLDDTLLTIKTASRIKEFPTLNKISSLLIQSSCDYRASIDHDILFLNLNGLDSYLDGFTYLSKNLKSTLRFVLGKNYTRNMTRIARRQWKDINYYNAGIMLIPNEQCSHLTSVWKEVVHEIDTIYDLRSNIGKVPFCNISLSLSLARANVPSAILPDTFNQRNWKELPIAPNVLHYNNYDKLNIHIKNNILYSLSDFKEFLISTDNRFWNKYRDQVLPLIDSRTEQTAELIKSSLKDVVDFLN